ncbi:hypothetical protein [Methyloversatilis sp.]|uniref:hypothetical protein n=1 Tax=Methyloversatilis sp. TaxID=2569862 RepID=UPI0035B064D7
MFGPFLSGNAVSIPVSLMDELGNLLTVNSIEYRILNQDNAVLVDRTSLDGYVAGVTDVDIAVAADKNALSEGSLKELRVVEVYLNTPQGVVRKSFEYIIEAESNLVEGVNSFQSYAKAILVASDIPRLDGWNGSDKTERTKALIRARHNIGMLRFRYVFDDQQDIIDNTLSVTNLSEATPEEYARLPKTFREALQRAQVIEADYLLGSDEAGEFRREGVMSRTVGESKQFFRPGKPLEGPVSQKTMRELTKWVLTRKRVGRAA